MGSTSGVGLAIRAIEGVLALGAVWYVTSTQRGEGWIGRAVEYLTPRQRSVEGSQDDKEKFGKDTLLRVLRELTTTFHEIFTDLGMMAANVLASIQKKGLTEAIPPAQVEDMIMQQGFERRLLRAQKAVFAAHGVTKGEVESASEIWIQRNDVDVKLYVEGIRAMRRDALEGTSPLLPGIEIPTTLTPELVFDIFSQIQDEKLKRFDEIFCEIRSHEKLRGDLTALSLVSDLDSSELTNRLKEATHAAENHVLQKAEIIALIGRAPVYFHALALYGRQNEDFKIRKSVAEAKHADKLVAVMREKPSESKGNDDERAVADDEVTNSTSVLSATEENCMQLAAEGQPSIGSQDGSQGGNTSDGIITIEKADSDDPVTSTAAVSTEFHTPSANSDNAIIAQVHPRLKEVSATEFESLLKSHRIANVIDSEVEGADTMKVSSTRMACLFLEDVNASESLRAISKFSELIEETGGGANSTHDFVVVGTDDNSADSTRVPEVLYRYADRKDFTALDVAAGDSMSAIISASLCCPKVLTFADGDLQPEESSEWSRRFGEIRSSAP